MTGLSSSNVSVANVNIFIGWAEAFMEKRANRKWTTSTSYSEYFDGLPSAYDKRWTDEGGRLIGTKPHVEEGHTFFLKNLPVLAVNNVFFLDRTLELGQEWSYDSSGTSYTDNTEEANSVGGTQFYAFAASVGTGDILYVGSSYKFLGLWFDLFTAGSGGVLVWEYYNGSSWTEVSGKAESASGADDLNAAGKVSWSLPANWDETSVNNSSDMYYVRARVTTAHTTSPEVNQIWFDHDGLISKEINPNDYSWNAEGRVFLISDTPSAGVKNVRMDYDVGVSSVPSYVEELATVLAAKKVFRNMIGASHDDLTSGAIGDESWAQGEPYMNLRDAYNKLDEREKELWPLVGVVNGGKYFVAST